MLHTAIAANTLLTMYVQQRFRMKCRPLFWAYARARYVGEFKEALKALTEENIQAWNYVNAIDHKLWTTYAYTYTRYGHDTNNITESVKFQ